MIINYFLILGVIVSVVFFLALLLNNISKLGRQSEKKDVIFTLLGFMLAMSILVLFFVVSSNLEKEYAGYLKQNESYILVDADIIAKTDDFITVVANGELINILKTADAKEKVLPVMTGKILVKVITYEAPETWYMMKWRVDAINSQKYYVLDTIYI